MNRGLLRILDILIVIAFIALLYILVEPQYKKAKISTKRRKLQANMFTVKAGIERYISFHKGKYPSNSQQIYENLAELVIPVNPYTNEKIEVSDLVQFEYDLPIYVKDRSLDGVNGKQTGKPGQIGIGFFIPIGEDSIPTKYGIIGFDENGKSLVIEEGDKRRVVVLIE